MKKETLDALLKTLRSGLDDILGDRLEAVYLYGSRARHDAERESDIDILIVIRGEFDYFEMSDITSDLTWKLSLDNDIVISRVFISRDKFEQADSPFLHNVSREAVLI